MASIREPLIPPERQSARIRQQTSQQSFQAISLSQDSSRNAKQGTRSSTRSKALASIPARAPVTEEDCREDEDDDDDSHEIEESDEDDGVTFKTKTKLPSAVVAKWRLGDLLPLIDTEWLDLDPEYQREVVWGHIGMTGLINSIIEEYYIPPIIFNLQVVETRNGFDYYKRICVDGKQRITSCYLFTQGDIPCTDKYGKKWWYCEKLDDYGRPVGQKNRRILPEEMKRVFNAKEFVCYEYKDLTPEQEEDLFARVQKGIQLSAAEKLRATTGPWQSLAKRFEQDFKSIMNRTSKAVLELMNARIDSVKTVSTYARSQGFQTLLSAFSQIVEVQYPSRDDGKPVFKSDIRAIQSLYTKGQLCNESIKAHLITVFQIFDDLVQMDRSVFENNGYKTARKFAPVEMIAVACLISKYHDTRNCNLLLGDIRAMRQQVRDALEYLRIHHVPWKTIWQFIDELESYRGRPEKPSSATETMRLPGNHFSRGPKLQSQPIQGQVAHPRDFDPYHQSPIENGSRSNQSTKSPIGDSGRGTNFAFRTAQESSYPPHPRPELLTGQNVYDQNTMPYSNRVMTSPTTNFENTVIKSEDGTHASSNKRRISGLDLGPRSSTAAALAAKRYKPSETKDP